MRIAYIVAGFPCLSETFVVNDVRGLEALGHEVTAVSLGPGDPAALGNPNYAIRGRTIRVAGLGRRPPLRKVRKLLGRASLRIRRGRGVLERFHAREEGVPDALHEDRLAWDAAIDQLDRAGPFDFLYVHFAMRQLLLGYHASRTLGIPLAATLPAHDIFANPLTGLFPWLLGRCSFVVTVSHYNAAEILRLAPGLDPGKVRVIANGVDLKRFRPAYHRPHRPFRFASTGRLVEIKGYHVLVEAAGLLLARGRRDFTIDVVGEGPMRGQLERRIAELGLAGHVRLLGRRDASFLDDFLPEQDCFVLPCVIARDGNRDGMPVALREAMACGLPALSTEILGIPEAVTPGTGLLVPAEDPSALADAMGRMMSLPAEEHAAMARAARFKAESEFSLERQVGMLSAWMEEALGCRRGSNGAAAADEVRPHADPTLAPVDHV